MRKWMRRSCGEKEEVMRADGRKGHEKEKDENEEGMRRKRRARSEETRGQITASIYPIRSSKDAHLALP